MYLTKLSELWRLANTYVFSFSFTYCLYTKDMGKNVLQYLLFKTNYVIHIINQKKYVDIL